MLSPERYCCDCFPHLTDTLAEEPHRCGSNGRMKGEEKNPEAEQRRRQAGGHAPKRMGVFTYLSRSGPTSKRPCPRPSRGAVTSRASFPPPWTPGPAVAPRSSQVGPGSSSWGPRLPGPHGCLAGWPGAPLTGSRCASCRGWELGASAPCTRRLTTACSWPSSK